jgi:hypothetical protein
MRQFSIAVFCIGFAMFGSLMPAVHTIAHAELVAEVMIDADYEHEFGHSAHDEDVTHHDTSDHHKPTDHKGDHGAELHGSALGVVVASFDLPLPSEQLKTRYRDFQYPAPLLPSDPDPDRA